MDKMKSIVTILTFISAMILGLSGCLTHSNMAKQMTVLLTDCEMEDVQITNEREELNSTRNWTAGCNGRTYQCNYHDDGGDPACYDITEQNKEPG